MVLFSLFASAFLAAASPASSPVLGNWITSNNSVVNVYSCGSNQVCIKLQDIGPKDTPMVDARNPDIALRTRSVCGMNLANDFKLGSSSSAATGHIYDPESGHTYSAKLWMDGDKLKLHGYIGVSLFGRTEEWHRGPATTTGRCPAQ